MPLIVTGCPRSGTTTMAHVLGILHEKQFGIRHVAGMIRRVANHAELGTLESEAAWPAAPFTRVLLEYECHVIHLVRNPRDCIASMMRRQMLNRGPDRNDEFIRKHARIPTRGTRCELLCHFWIEWNRMLSAMKLPRIRIEDVLNAPRLHAGLTHKRLEWDAIPLVYDLATEYGYTS